MSNIKATAAIPAKLEVNGDKVPVDINAIVDKLAKDKANGEESWPTLFTSIRGWSQKGLINSALSDGKSADNVSDIVMRFERVRIENAPLHSRKGMSEQSLKTKRSQMRAAAKLGELTTAGDTAKLIANALKALEKANQKKSTLDALYAVASAQLKAPTKVLSGDEIAVCVREEQTDTSPKEEWEEWQAIMAKAKALTEPRKKTSKRPERKGDTTKQAAAIVEALDAHWKARKAVYAKRNGNGNGKTETAAAK